MLQMEICNDLKLESLQPDLLSIAFVYFTTLKITDDLKSSGGYKASISPKLPCYMKPQFY